MPRKARLTVTGAIHHLMSRGNEGKPIFIDNEDRQFFLTILEDLLGRSNYLLYAWCLMDNHYHLLVRINEYPLGSFMRICNGRYAQYFQKKRKTRGHLFQDRYKSIVTQDQHYIEEMVRYIHLNPIRAGICAGCRDLDVYPWTGHSVLIGKRSLKMQNVADVLRRFDRQKTRAIKKYKDYLNEGLLKESDFYETIRKTNYGLESMHTTGCWVIGNREFVNNALIAGETSRIRIARYAREWGVFSLEVAVQKLTSLPASRVGITDRGVLRPGLYADITVFDPKTVIDRETFKNSHAFPAGIEYVIVNGQLVVERGAQHDVKPGQIL